jgi:hypothetical protein
VRDPQLIARRAERAQHRQHHALQKDPWTDSCHVERDRVKARGDRALIKH